MKITESQHADQNKSDPQKQEKFVLDQQILLRERIKELACFYKLSELIENCSGEDSDINALFQGAVDVLPESWLYPEIAHGRIIFEDKEFLTPNFQKCSWVLSADIMVSGNKTGLIEVHYQEERPDIDEGPFLKEERSLINALAERLGKVVERFQAQQLVLIEQEALQRKNIALSQILDRIQEEKSEIGRQIMTNVERVIMPMIDTLDQGLSKRQQKYTAMIRENLEEITSPFIDKLSRDFASLTPTEIRICRLIKRGMICKEIATLEQMSPGTVRVHRFKIRKKLGLTNKKINLLTFLQSITAK